MLVMTDDVSCDVTTGCAPGTKGVFECGPRYELIPLGWTLPHPGTGSSICIYIKYYINLYGL